MSGQRTYVLTGATSGMGLVLAEELARTSDVRLIVGARSSNTAAALKDRIESARLAVLPLDLLSLSSVLQFCSGVMDDLAAGTAIDAIVCNAGVQLTGERTMTADGVEATFAANHLGHFLLVQTLLPALRHGGLVTVTGSGTHDPDDWLARRFGFRGGLFPSALAVSRGDLDALVSMRQQGMDRYATSKLCNVLWVKEMARRLPPDRAKFLAFDPGLMPGTGLARDRSWLERFGWRYVLPSLRLVVPGVSTARRSAVAYAKLIRTLSNRYESGAYVDFNLASIHPAEAALREDFARDLYDVSLRLVERKAMAAVP